MPPGPSRGTRGSPWRFILLAVAAAQPQQKDLTIFYNVYMHNRTALARTPVVGVARIAAAVETICGDIGARCTHLGHAEKGSELQTLMPLHTYCTTNPEATVAYIHDKGSYHQKIPFQLLATKGKPQQRGFRRPIDNAEFRRALMRGVFSYNETAPASSLLLRHYAETRQPPISPMRPGRPGKKNADLPRRKKKSAFQGRPAAPPRPRKNWSPREVADEAGRNNI